MSFLVFVLAMLNSVFAFAINGRTTYQARIIKPDGYPLQSSSVNFRFSVLDQSGSCVLYVEDYAAINMTDTGGVISFPLGSGTRAFPTSGTSQTFQNTFDNSIASFACQTMGIYNPNPTDSRKVVMQFNDGVAGWQTLPAMSLNAVPYAMFATRADNSRALNGKADTSFVEYATLNGLNSGSGCAADEALRYNGVSFSCVQVGASSTAVTSGSVITALGYTPVAPASLTAVASSLSTTDSTLSTVSGAVYSVSSTVANLNSTVTSLANSTAASFAAITSSQWTNSASGIYYEAGPVSIGTSATAPASYAMLVSGSLLVQGAGNAVVVPTNNALMHMRQSQIDSWPQSSTGFEFSIGSGVTRKIYFYNRSTSGALQLLLDGAMGIGTTTPVTALDVSGGVRISYHATCTASYAGTLRYSGGLVEYCNGTSWSAFGVAGAGITSLNGSVSGSQSFAVGNSGTAFNISTLSGQHTFNIPYAASAGVTAGLLSFADYSTFNNKMAATSAAIISALSYTPANSVSVTTLSSTVSSLSAQVATSFTALTSTVSAITASVSSITSSQWVTSGSTIYYSTGNVGVGTSNPTVPLHVFRSTGNSNISIQTAASSAGGAALNLGTGSYGGNAWQLVKRDDGYLGAPQGAFMINNGLIAPLVITQSGTVGIGLTNPDDTLSLHIQKAIDARAHLNSLSGSSGLELRTGSASSAGGGYIDFATSATSTASPDYDFRLIQNSTGLSFQTPGSNSRMMLNAAGNVGIGTDTPETKFEVAGDITTTGGPAGLSLKAGASDHAYISYFARTASPTTRTAYVGFPSAGSNAFNIFNETATGIFVVGTSGTERLRIDSAGNLGVATTVPTARLHLASGTASLAPLKLTSGSLLASPQAGAVEFDGNNFYITDSSNQRRAIATGSSVGTIDNASTINATGNITLSPTGSVVVSSTTASTSSNTGALVVQGGLGVAGAINTGGNLNVSGSTVIDGSLRLPSMTNGSVLFVSSTGTVAQNNSNFFWDNPDSQLGIGYNSPSAKIHIGGSISGAYRSWMENGIIFGKAGDSDGGYIGLKDEGANRQDVVIAWGDDNTDNLRFINARSGGASDGVEAMRIDASTNVGIGTSSPLKNLHVASGTMFGLTAGFPAAYTGVQNEFHNGSLKRWTETSGNQVNLGVYSMVDIVSSSTKSNHGIANIYFTNIPAGVSSTGTNHGFYNMALRNRYAGNTDSGNVNLMRAILNEYGHQSDVPGNAPTTTNMVGLSLNPMAMTGSITNLYDLFISTPAGGGSVSSHFAVYQQATTAKNYFAAKTGFGTTNPEKLVHISGSGSNGLLLDNGTTDGTNLIFHDASQGVSGVTWNMDSTDGALRFFTEPITSLNPLTATNGIERMVITSTGLVGVGTGAPLDEFTLSNDGNGDTTLNVMNVGSGTLARAALTLTNSGTAYGVYSGGMILGGVSHTSFANQLNIFTNSGIVSGIHIHASYATAPVILSTQNVERMRVAAGGNIGIGTATPAGKLTVEDNYTGAQISVGITLPGVAVRSSNDMVGMAMIDRDYDNNTTNDRDGMIYFGDDTTDNLRFMYAGSGLPVAEYMRITGTGNVGIGTSAPTSRLDVRGGNTFMEGRAYVYSNSGWGSVTPSISLAVGDNDTGLNWVSDGVLQIYSNNAPRMHFAISGATGINRADPSYNLDVAGTFRVTGQAYTDTGAATFTVLSDERYKDIHGSYNRGLNELLNIGTIRYNYKKVNPTGADSSKEWVGVSAQNVQANIPEAVTVEHKDGKEFLTVNPSAIIFAMINGFREMYAKVVALMQTDARHDREIASLKTENEELKLKVKEFDELKAYICKKDPQAPNCK